MQVIGPPKPTFTLEPLEPRILLSGTWVDTDTGDPLSGATSGDDTYTGTTGDDVADGLGGDDTLYGLNGQDTLSGGAGDDVLYGDHHDDILDGGAGDDQLFGGFHRDTLISGGGNDYMDGGKHDDTFRFTGAQDGDMITVVGGEHNDTIDLSGYSNNQITDDGSTMTVDMGGGQSFTINYSEIESIRTSEGTYTPGNIPGGDDEGQEDDDDEGQENDDDEGQEDDDDEGQEDDDDEGQEDDDDEGQEDDDDEGQEDGDDEGQEDDDDEGQEDGDDEGQEDDDEGEEQPDNNLPNTVADTVTTVEDTPVTTGNVLSNDSDPDGDTLSVTGFTQAANGTVVDNGDGTFTYTPNANFSGTDSFTYTVDDGNGGTDTATVTVTVNPVNDAPTASAGPDQTVDGLTQVTLDATGSSDLEGDGLTYRWTQIDGPAVALSDPTAAQPTFGVPDVSVPTTLTFKVEVSDGQSTSTDTVSVVVNPVDSSSSPPPPASTDPAEDLDRGSHEAMSSLDPANEVNESETPPGWLGPAADGSLQGQAQNAAGIAGSNAESDNNPGTANAGSNAAAAAGDTTMTGTMQSNVPTSDESSGPAFDGTDDLDLLDPMEDLAGAVELNQFEQQDADDLEPADEDTGYVEAAGDNAVTARFEVERVIELPSMEARSSSIPFGTPVGAADAPAADVFDSEEMELPPAMRINPSPETVETMTPLAQPVEAHEAERRTERTDAGESDEAAARSSRHMEDDSPELPAYDPDGPHGESARVIPEAAGFAGAAMSGFFARLWGAVRGLGATSRSMGDNTSQTDRQARNH